LRIFAHLTVIWTNVCSTALARRRVFTQPRPTAVLAVAVNLHCNNVGTRLLDHLVGEDEQGGRNGQAERFGSFEIDD
jgi:hypothetical protein